MAQSKASKAAEFSTRKQRVEEDDLAGLPESVKAGILAVEEASWDIHERVQLAEELWDTQPDSELALEPGNHAQTSWAQHFALVDGEIVEITKESATTPVTLTYRPELKPSGDPLSALQARMQRAAE